MPNFRLRRAAQVGGLLLTIAALGCGRPTLGGPKQRARVVDNRDAGPRRDGGVIVDAGAPRDAGVRPPLGEALSCSLSREEALAAAVRWRACDIEGVPYTVQTVVEAYEGFVLGSFNTPVANFSGLPTSCALWQCAAEATSCAALSDCLDGATLRFSRCFDGEPTCDGDVLTTCWQGRILPHIDCAALGAQCRRAACEFDGCSIDAFNPELRCIDNAISGCDGQLRLSCDEWNPGSACASFYVSGELDVLWCSPTGRSEAGAYFTPVACNGGEISFTSVTGRAYRYSCRANGYVGCDERGCR